MRNPLQLVLDFLSPPPEPAQTLRVPSLVKSPAPSSSAAPLSDEVAIAHPRANRETVLEGMRVAYLFQRVRRRSIGFVVGPDGLEVRAPKWVTLKEVELGLQERGEWVLRKWAELQERQKNIRQIEWREGASLDYLGAPLHLHLSPQNGRSELNDQRQLLLALPHTAEASQIRDAVQAWLMREAKILFEQRLNHFAPLMGVQWRRLSLSNAGSRWGSARVDGAIRLNWRLIHLKPEAIDYVVVHELAHLREMNHSPAFWKVVADILPDHLERRKALQKENLANWA
ncbi:MAG: SprT family zinc-dependent metalloprotease [Burkholderiales bacterium]|nr:SprT family zinc-dependent metalloprotease [Burkholderiales bacterium]